MSEQVFIGIDVHKLFCQICLVNFFKNEISNVSVKTDKRSLTKFFNDVKRNYDIKLILMEIGAMSKAVSRHLRVKKFSVALCSPLYNKEIFLDPKKSDKKDALKLAKRATDRDYAPVHLTREKHWDLSQNFKQCLRLRKSLHRQKNQTYSFLKEHFVMNVDIKLIQTSELERDNITKQISGESSKAIFFREVTSLTSLQKNFDDQWKITVKEARQDKSFLCLQSIPGVGPKTAAAFMAIIDDPYRFKSRKAIWDYCGLGQRGQMSAGKVTHKKGIKKWNKTLFGFLRKAVDRSRTLDSYFKKYYLQQLQNGFYKKDAFFRTARKMVSTMWSIMRNNSSYNELKHLYS